MEDTSKVGGTNPLVVPGVKKLGGTAPPVPMVVAPMEIHPLPLQLQWRDSLVTVGTGLLMRPNRARMGDTLLSQLVFLRCNNAVYRLA